MHVRGVGPRLMKRLIGKANLIIMASLSWPNQKPLVCPLAYITSVMTSPTFKAHLEAPPLGLVGSFTSFELERGETMCHKLERERDGELALMPL